MAQQHAYVFPRYVGEQKLDGECVAQAVHAETFDTCLLCDPVEALASVLRSSFRDGIASSDRLRLLAPDTYEVSPYRKQQLAGHQVAGA